MAKQKNSKPAPSVGRKRQRKDADLSALYAVPGTIAYDKNGNLRPEVLGVVRPDLPVVSKPGKGDKPSTFVRDFSDLPKACKNRVIAFREDKANAKKTKCFLAEKPLYDEMKQSQKALTQNPHKNGASSKSGF